MSSLSTAQLLLVDDRLVAPLNDNLCHVFMYNIEDQIGYHCNRNCNYEALLSSEMNDFVRGHSMLAIIKFWLHRIDIDTLALTRVPMGQHRTRSPMSSVFELLMGLLLEHIDIQTG